MARVSAIRIVQVVVLFIVAMAVMGNLQDLWGSLKLPNFGIPFKFPDLPKGEPYKIPFTIGASKVNADHQYAKEANKEITTSLGFTLENDLAQADATPMTLAQMETAKRANPYLTGNLPTPSVLDPLKQPIVPEAKKPPVPVASLKNYEGFSNCGKNIPGYTFAYGSSLEGPPLTPEELRSGSDFTVHQNKMQANAMNNMNQEAAENQSNFLSNAMFYSNTTNISGIELPKSQGSYTSYVIGNGVEVYDDRLKFDPESLVTNQMRHLNENYNLGKNYDIVSTKGINEFNERVTFVPPIKSKKLFQEQLRTLGESDITLEDALEIQKNGGNPGENKPIEPSNAYPQMFDNAEFVSDTKTPFSRSIGIHPVKRHAYQPKKNVLSNAGHFTLSKYNPTIDYNRNYMHGKGYAPSNIPRRNDYTIDFNTYIPSHSKSNLNGNMNKLMYDTNFKYFKKGFQPNDTSPNIKYMNTGSEYADAYGSCY